MTARSEAIQADFLKWAEPLPRMEILVDAISTRDGDRAEEFMRQLLHNAINGIRKVLMRKG
jgi:DNA-binding GntR family transcriptional regulator